MQENTSIGVASLLRELADVVGNNKSAAVLVADESVAIPADAKFRVDYERGTDAAQVVVTVKWGLESALPLLIHTYSDHVQDSQGHLFRVLVYGEPRTDGTWEAYLEFVPTSSAQNTLRTGRETTQTDRRALEYWATGLEPLYLAGAFARAA
jgi:hypothetical protein